MLGIFGIVVGINGYIVWGFMNVNLDNVDWIELGELMVISMVIECIFLFDGEYIFEFEVSLYGLVKEFNGKCYVFNWVVYYLFVVNLGIINFGNVKNV